jgi:hypothetical protein
MAQHLILCDDYGIIQQAMKVLPNDSLKIDFLAALAELEDGECHRTRKFPKTRLHKVKGVKQAIYRADGFDSIAMVAITRRCRSVCERLIRL